MCGCDCYVTAVALDIINSVVVAVVVVAVIFVSTLNLSFSLLAPELYTVPNQSVFCL